MEAKEENPYYNVPQKAFVEVAFWSTVVTEDCFDNNNQLHVVICTELYST